jgi:cysteine desulfurase
MKGMIAREFALCFNPYVTEKKEKQMQTTDGRIYLDYAASTPVRQEVRDAMYMWHDEYFGNPSSIHSFGQKLRNQIDRCRDQIKQVLNCSYREIVFLSGATEGDNWALKGLADSCQDKGRHFIISGIEHHAVIESAHYLEECGYTCTKVIPGADGVIRVEDVEAAIIPQTAFISMMMVNNELGTVQPVKEVAKLAKSRGIMFHTDCAQALSTRKIDLQKVPIDILTSTAHKIYGPVGSGFNFIRKDTKIHSMIHGGSHEFGLRAGTENVAGITGLATAVELAGKEIDESVKRYTEFGRYMFEQLSEKAPHVKPVGNQQKKAPHIYCLHVPGVKAENMLLGFNKAGIAIATGSACASGSAEPSHVMKAIGFGYPEAFETIRVSFGIYTKKEHIDRFIETLCSIIESGGDYDL